MNIKVKLNSDHETLCSVADGFFSDNPDDELLVFEPDSQLAQKDNEALWTEKREHLALTFLKWHCPSDSGIRSFAVQYIGQTLVVSNQDIGE